ncbi:MAG: hypothetical protein ABIG90_01820 [bacterium]
MITWQAKEFKKNKTSRLWYIVWALLSLAIIVFAVIEQSPLMALVFVLISIIAYLFNQQEPKKNKFVLSKKGVQVQDKLYSYDELESFWIFYDPPRKKILSVKSEKILMPYFNIPLAKQNPIKIRKYLLKFLPEKEHQESLVENILSS